MPATHALTAYPRHPSHPNEYCRFAAEWIRTAAGHDIGANGASAASAYPTAARAFRRAYPVIAHEVDQRIGSWPSSEREFRALQSTR